MRRSISGGLLAKPPGALDEQTASSRLLIPTAERGVLVTAPRGQRRGEQRLLEGARHAELLAYVRDAGDAYEFMRVCTRGCARAVVGYRTRRL